MEKLLTIGICSYNNEPFIGELIYQIKNQYEEVKEFVDFYIYDDCSTSLPVFPDFCNIFVGEANMGSPSYGRNYTGELYIFLMMCKKYFCWLMKL